MTTVFLALLALVAYFLYVALIDLYERTEA